MKSVLKIVVPLVVSSLRSSTKEQVAPVEQRMNDELDQRFQKADEDRQAQVKEISAELHISESTVKFHLARLFEKFGVRRRSDLILQTVQQTAAVVH